MYSYICWTTKGVYITTYSAALQGAIVKLRKLPLEYDEPSPGNTKMHCMHQLDIQEKNSETKQITVILTCAPACVNSILVFPISRNVAPAVFSQTSAKKTPGPTT